MKQKILFIESNLTTGFDAMLYGADREAEVLFVTADVESYRRRSERFRDELEHRCKVLSVGSTQCPDILWKAIGNLEASAFLTFSDPHVAIVCEMARRKGLPSLDPTVARTCKDKFQTRALVEGASIMRQPRYRKVHSLEEAQIFLQELDGACILKPREGHGSLAVARVNSASELEAAWKNMQATAAATGEISRAALMEAFLEGSLFSAEVWAAERGSYQLLGFTSRILGGQSNFVELGGTFPYPFPERLYDKISHAIFETLEIVGYDFGPAHVEFLLKDEEIYLIEINPRLAGGIVPDLIGNTYGRSIYADILDLYSRRRNPQFENPQNYHVIRAVCAPRAGVLRGVHLPEKFFDDRVRRSLLLKKVGDVVQLPHSNADRLGFFVVTAETAAEAESFADEVCRGIVCEF